jgi:glycosyl transferase family 87
LITRDERWRVPLLAGLALAYLVLDVLVPLRHVLAGTGDFRFYLGAGEMLLAGRSPYLLDYWGNPPLVAFLMAPFAALPRTAAWVAWFAISQAATLFAAAWTWRAERDHPWAGVVVAATWVAGHALVVSLAEGQVNSLLVALLCVALWPPARRHGVATIAVAVATALKLWPGILFLVDLLQRRFRVLVGGGLLAAALVVIPQGILALTCEGPMRPRYSEYWLGTPAFLNGSLPGTALRLREPLRAGEELPANWVVGNQTEKLRLTPADRAFSFGIAVATVLLGLALLLRVSRRVPGVEPWRWGSALVALALLAAPVSWPHYQVLQLPGTAALTLDWGTRRRWYALAGLWAAFLIAQWTEYFVMGPYLASFGTRAGSPLAAWGLSTAPTLAGIALFACQLEGIRRDRAGGTPGLPGG